MTEMIYMGARMEKEIMNMIEQTAKEEHVDKTKALKELVILGRKEYLLQKQLEAYRKGRCSIDKAAQVVGITVTEMMEEVTRAGIRSTQTIEEYKEGLKLLM